MSSISNEVQDVTDTGSGGWVSRIAGVNSAELTFRAFWNSAAPLSGVFNIGTKVSVSLAIGDSSVNVVGDFYISSFTITNNAKTPVEFQCTGQNDGAVTVS